MKIHTMLSGIKSASLSKETQQVREKTKENQKAGAENRADKVSLSSNSRERMEIRETKASSVEDFRSERIERLKHQIQSGTYTPDPERIAKAMLSAHRDSMI
ncbi:flagellar biosynthesis anti-sigma factor FlgM [Desulfobotulus sp. H1]|uniref:Negative regulator of flagellin synthesis n=1 Tax=Desulfobotulus pelophilus TaxID=2823377 RepID=A0ABT3N631_9BACT|nr:flagellar biosynthesis anti-sigma factor FlgM [Desulfobotulus pelophilus]MCW7752492.1 flagellar biosynthesis anti-sigma factor FlgM [Desulfobotulus pelophilus]